MRKFILVLLSISFFSCLFHGCRLDEIAPATIADFNILGGPIHIQGEAITFENTSRWYEEGAKFIWNFGDGRFSDTLFNKNSVSHTYDTTGTYTITLTAFKPVTEKEKDYSTSKDTTITISAIALPDPEAAFTATPDSSPCIVPCLVGFVDQSQNHDSTLNVWDFGDGGSSTETSPSYTYEAVGMYTPTLTVMNSQGKIDTLNGTEIIVIDPEEPMPVARFTIDNPDACTVAPCTFMLMNTSINADSFFWDFFADGNIDTITTNTDPIPFYTIEWGTIPINLTAKNNSGNIAMYMDSVFLATPDTPKAFFTIDVNPCTAPCNAVFSQFSVGADIILMDYGDGSDPVNEALANDFFYTYAAPGIYEVTMTVSLDDAPYTDTHTDTIYVVSPNTPPPVANFGFSIQDYTVDFTNLSQDADSSMWIWNFGDGSPNSSDENPQHTYANTGSYAVNLTVFSTSGVSDDTTMMVTILCSDSTYEKTQGSSLEERTLAIAAHPDGGFVMAGSTRGNSLGVLEAGWIVHVDVCGDTVWTKEYILGGSVINRFHSITPRADGGGFVAGGYSNVSTTSSRSGWILKINNDGSVVWNQAVTYLNWHAVHIEEIIGNPLGGYLAVGRASEFPPIPNTFVQNRRGFLIKINDLGTSATTTVDIIEDQSLNPYLESYFKAIYADSSGDVFLAGHLRPDSMNTAWQARFVRYNLASNSIIADVSFGDLNKDEQLFDIIENPAGEFVMCGSHNSTRFWVVKVDNMGANLVEGNITLSESNSTAENITMNQSGTQYALTGFARNSTSQVFLITLDLSMNTIILNRRFGTSGEKQGREILLTPDGGYFIGAESDDGVNEYDAYYIRTDINGLTQ